MRKILIVPVLLMAAITANAQMRQSDIVSAGGGFAEKGTLSLSSTIGEPVGGTLTQGTLTLVLGFQQAIDVKKETPPETGINDAYADSDANVQIFPNPVNDVVNVKVSNIDTEVTVQIMNTTGAVVVSEDFDPAQTLSVNVADLTKGIYLVKVITDSKVVKTQKIIKL